MRFVSKSGKLPEKNGCYLQRRTTRRSWERLCWRGRVLIEEKGWGGLQFLYCFWGEMASVTEKGTSNVYLSTNLSGTQIKNSYHRVASRFLMRFTLYTGSVCTCVWYISITTSIIRSNWHGFPGDWSSNSFSVFCCCSSCFLLSQTWAKYRSHVSCHPGVAWSSDPILVRGRQLRALSAVDRFNRLALPKQFDDSRTPRMHIQCNVVISIHHCISTPLLLPGSWFPYSTKTMSTAHP